MKDGQHADLIELEGVGRSYEREDGFRIQALRDVSLGIQTGEYVCITGPSGSGKTTLMNIIGCLDQPTTGAYRLSGRNVQGLGANALAWLRRRFFGYIFQSWNLLASATVCENVELPGMYAGLPRGFRRQRAVGLLSRLNLDARTEHLPAELSGGEQQRVAIARALMNNGRVILADEPTGALDEKSGETVLDTLEQLTEQGHTVIVISHNAKVAARARRQITLRDGQIVGDSGPSAGRLSEQAPPNSPAPPRVQGHLAAIMEAARGGWTTLRRNYLRGARLRTLLPIGSLAIAVALGGIAVGVGSGVYRAFSVENLRFGVDAIKVLDSPQSLGDPRWEGFTLEDARAIESQVSHVRAVSPSMGRRLMVRRNDASAEMFVEGFVDLGAQAGRDRTSWRLASGASITRQDDDNMAQVAVIGATARELLFPDGADPIGEIILIENQPFRVKGVLAHRPRMGWSASEEIQREAEDRLNRRAFVPFQTAASVLFGSDKLDSITAFVRDPEQIFDAASEIQDLMVRRLGGPEAFHVAHPGQAAEEARKVRAVLWLGLGTIAVIALLAGSFGVMSIMLASVLARRREIGIRMAVGARRGDIQRQFLAETIAICGTGSAAGLLLGLLAVFGLRLFAVPIDISPWTFLVPLVPALLAGFLCGIVPARRAARLTPVEALAAD